MAKSRLKQLREEMDIGKESPGNYIRGSELKFWLEKVIDAILEDEGNDEKSKL